MTTKEAKEIVGSLSAPSKMPCYGYSIPARHCKTGSKLVDVENSVCADCYALKGFYRFSNVQSVLEKRFQSLTHPLWVDAMVLTISQNEFSGFFRWHDSGDLQGVWHLQNICEVARRLPLIRFWLPTKELAILREFSESGFTIPENLTVRVSGFMVDGKAPESFAREHGFTVSTVQTSQASCPSGEQGNKCLTCRACWDKNVFSVSYKKH